jgi:hypothetical protein
MSTTDKKEPNKNLKLAKEANKVKISTLDAENTAMLQALLELGFFKLSQNGGKAFSLWNIKTLIEQKDEKEETYKPATYGTYKQRQETGKQVKKGAVGCWLAIPLFQDKTDDKPSNFTFKPFFAEYQTEPIQYTV